MRPYKSLEGWPPFSVKGQETPQLCLPAVWPYPSYMEHRKVSGSRLTEGDFLGGAHQQHMLQSKQDPGIPEANLKTSVTLTEEKVYKAFIRPILEHASSVWDPTHRRTYTK